MCSPDSPLAGAVSVNRSSTHPDCSTRQRSDTSQKSSTSEMMKAGSASSQSTVVGSAGGDPVIEVGPDVAGGGRLWRSSRGTPQWTALLADRRVARDPPAERLVRPPDRHLDVVGGQREALLRVVEGVDPLPHPRGGGDHVVALPPPGLPRRPPPRDG